MKLCLGTVQFGMDYGVQGNGKPQAADVFRMIDLAAENGITVLDTADAYGDAQMVIGEYFRSSPEQRDKISVISKLAPDAFEEHDPDTWGDIALQHAASDLAGLGIDRLEAYLFHRSSLIFDDRAVDALTKVLDKGLSNRIGVSVYTPEEAMKALEYPQIGAVQIPYNLFDRRLDHAGFFDRLSDRDIKIYARSSLLQGLIMMSPDSLPAYVSFARDNLARFRKICDIYSVEPLEAAIGYLNSKKGIDYIVFGVDNIVQLQQYIALSRIDLPEEMIDDINSAFDCVDERLVNPSLWKKEQT